MRKLLNTLVSAYLEPISHTAHSWSRRLVALATVGHLWFLLFRSPMLFGEHQLYERGTGATWFTNFDVSYAGAVVILLLGMVLGLWQAFGKPNRILFAILALFFVVMQQRVAEVGYGGTSFLQLLLTYHVAQDWIGGMPGKRTTTWPLRLAQLNFVLVYVSSALAKWEYSSWRDGTVLARNAYTQYTYPWADIVLLNPVASTVLAYAAIVLYLFIVPQLFSNGWMRRVAIVSVLMFHGSIGMLMNVELFGMVMFAGVFLFLRDEDVVWLRRLVQKPVKTLP